MSRPNWKQITFIGYYMNSQNMIDFIDIAKDNGITHILLEFITLGVNNDCDLNINLNINYDSTDLQEKNDINDICEMCNLC
jgi:hypothetical protein